MNYAYADWASNSSPDSLISIYSEIIITCQIN